MHRRRWLLEPQAGSVLGGFDGITGPLELAGGGVHSRIVEVECCLAENVDESMVRQLRAHLERLGRHGRLSGEGG